MVTNERKPVMPIESESHLVASILSSILEVPIVMIGSTLEKYVRPFLPTVNKVLENAIIYLAHNTKDDIYYNTRDKGICVIQYQCFVEYLCIHRYGKIACPILLEIFKLSRKKFDPNLRSPRSDTFTVRPPRHSQWCQVDQFWHQKSFRNFEILGDFVSR